MLYTHLVVCLSSIRTRKLQEYVHATSVHCPTFHLDDGFIFFDTYRTGIQAPIVKMRFLLQYQCDRTIQSSARIPARALFHVLQMNADIQLGGN